MNTKKHNVRSLLHKGLLENIAMAIIGLGAFMLMQPFSLVMYSQSFKCILLGTVTFVVVSHFPEE